MKALHILAAGCLLAGCLTEGPLPTHAMPEVQPTPVNGPRQFRQFQGAPVEVEVNTIGVKTESTELAEATKDFLTDELAKSGVKVQGGAGWKVHVEVVQFGHDAANFNGDNCISVVTRVVRPNQAFLAPDMKTDRCAINGQGMFAGGGAAATTATFPKLDARLEKLKAVKDEPTLSTLYQTVMLDVLTKLDR